MFTVYALYSANFSKIYIGFTSNLEQRLLSHNNLATKGFTFKFRPWVLVYQERLNTKKEALIREKQLKTARGRAFIWALIKEKF